MFRSIEPWHLIVVLLVILVIFGAPKLPSVAKNLGKSMKIFKSEVKDLRGDDSEEKDTPQEITDAQRAGEARTGTATSKDEVPGVTVDETDRKN
ncbi:Sec-independent protein translocase subunit TatA [Brevibacterium litoralis]|uniref:Sec-independent protein translocase subunit TatA n=1 Tax=Brevibacterium litoralis TaxID=3138935 RepID=UPI0032F06B1C